MPSGIHYVGSIFAVALVAFWRVAKALAQYFGSVEIQYVGQAAITDLRNDIYEKLLRQPIGFFQKQATGRLMSGVINDVERARGVLAETLAVGFRQVFTMVSLVLVLLAINWKMAMGAAVFLPLVILPVGYLGRRIRRSVKASQSRLGDLTQILQETFGGNRVVKAFGMERFEIGRFQEAARRLLRENMRWIRAQMVTPPLMDVLSGFVVVPVLLYARSEIKHGQMTIGDFLTFAYALFKAYEPIKGLGNVYQQFEQAHGATSQVFTFLELQEEVQEQAGSRALPPFSRAGRIRPGRLCLRSGNPYSARHSPSGARRRSGGHCGFERSGEDHSGESFAALSRRHLRRPAHRRRGRARGYLELSARADGHRYSGDHPVPRHGVEQHLLRPAQSVRGAGACRRPRRAGP